MRRIIALLAGAALFYGGGYVLWAHFSILESGQSPSWFAVFLAAGMLYPSLILLGFAVFPNGFPIGRKPSQGG